MLCTRSPRTLGCPCGPCDERYTNVSGVVRYEIFRTDESEADDHLIRPPQGLEDIVRVRPVKYRLVYADELALIMRHAFAHLQDPNGGSIYLRLSTRSVQQLQRVVIPRLRLRAWPFAELEH